MKKFIIITLAFIVVCVAVAGIFYWVSLPPKPVHGTIVGEVVATKSDAFVYVKPVGDKGTKQLLELCISSDTSFDSGDFTEGQSIDTIPELIVGTIVKIEYTYQAYDKYSGRTTADSIKTVTSDATSNEWPSLVLHEDYSWNSWDTGTQTTGEVIYVAKLDSPIEGYMVYINHNSEYRIQQYFIETNNMFLTDELKELLEQKEVGYTVKAKGLATAPFEKSIIIAAISIDLVKE